MTVESTVAGRRRGTDRGALVPRTDNFFGEGCLAGQVQRISPATAITDSTIARLEKSAIVKLIHDEPAFSAIFNAHLSSRTIRV
jgi:CRP/FNR family transcriptional regulator, cyclic AMP receptor protein